MHRDRFKIGEKCGPMPVESMRKALKTQRFQGFVYCAERGNKGDDSGKSDDPSRKSGF